MSIIPSIDAIMHQVRRTLGGTCPTCKQAIEIDVSNEKCGACGAKMVVRHNRKTDQRFMGCSKYPTCKNTESFEKMIVRRMNAVPDPIEDTRQIYL